MKKTPLMLRRCSPQVHAAAEKPVTGKEAAVILRRFQKMLTRDDHRKIAKGIEEARRRMA